ncbi:hypothetical protein D9M71_264920 [compost metagenome]
MIKVVLEVGCPADRQKLSFVDDLRRSPLKYPCTGLSQTSQLPRQQCEYFVREQSLHQPVFGASVSAVQENGMPTHLHEPFRDLNQSFFINQLTRCAHS